jgi:hypothetical protein
LTTRRISINGRANAMLFDGGPQFRTSWARSPQLIFYGGIGLGVRRTNIGLEQAIIGGAPGLAFSGEQKQYDLMGTVETGIRYHFTEHSGLQFDARVFKGPAVPVFGRFAVGFFYQIR